MHGFSILHFAELSCCQLVSSALHLSGQDTSAWKKITRKMEALRSEFEGFSPEEVNKFVKEKKLLDKEDADKLLVHKVDGCALLESSVDEAMALYGLPAGAAKSLVSKLKKMFPGEGFVE